MMGTLLLQTMALWEIGFVTFSYLLLLLPKSQNSEISCTYCILLIFLTVFGWRLEPSSKPYGWVGCCRRRRRCCSVDHWKSNSQTFQYICNYWITVFYMWYSIIKFNCRFWIPFHSLVCLVHWLVYCTLKTTQLEVQLRPWSLSLVEMLRHQEEDQVVLILMRNLMT